MMLIKKTLRIFLRNKIREIRNFSIFDNFLIYLVTCLGALAIYIVGISYVAIKIAKYFHIDEKWLALILMLGLPFSILVIYNIVKFIRWIIESWKDAYAEAWRDTRTCETCKHEQPNHCPITHCYRRNAWEKK